MAEEVAVQNQEAAPAERPKVDKPEVLIFGKYSTNDIVIEDAGLAKYIDLESMMVPHSGGKHANMWFGKSKLSIVERLINNIMRTEKYTGKKLKAYKAVSDAFDIIAAKTKKKLQFGGISVPKAVDISPQRRLDIALRNLSAGVVAASAKNKKAIQDCLADEIMLAAKGDMTSFSVAKKEETERVAQSAR